ncbi:hypothetical protein [Vibrio furnissii]|uniref:hypothetical protein n=1 Tax=Vibrio furnissii TaxID=29494 RepID=UPI001DA43A7B|nr:hypothetical protein [Vibrio furnissii]EJG2258846.1 hypothetical protein [Vibrio parahaemolyticus]EKO3889187.1 hypothetical protein [Vibrio metschnikovii]WJG24398.1 hypothetical protein QSU95_18130 [Vibrio furnissii]
MAKLSEIFSGDDLMLMKHEYIIAEKRLALLLNEDKRIDFELLRCIKIDNNFLRNLVSEHYDPDEFDEE